MEDEFWLILQSICLLQTDEMADSYGHLVIWVLKPHESLWVPRNQNCLQVIPFEQGHWDPLLISFIPIVEPAEEAVMSCTNEQREIILVDIWQDTSASWGLQQGDTRGIANIIKIVFFFGIDSGCLWVDSVESKRICFSGYSLKFGSNSLRRRR